MAGMDQTMRMLALDVGDRRIGVAVSDPMGIIARALTVIERKGGERDLEAILRLVEENRVGRIIVGLPRLMDGRSGAQAEKARAFAERLAHLTSVPVETFDERLSSSIAEELLREGGKNPREIKSRRDAFAAALILQWYLDERCHPPADPEREEGTPPAE